MSVDFGGEFNANETEIIESNFELLPEGIYQAKIVDSEKAPISSKADKGECLVLVWEITQGEFANRRIWQRLNLWAANFQSKDGGDGSSAARARAQSDLAKIGLATGKPVFAGSGELHERPCLIKVRVKKDKTGQYSDQNEISDVKALGAAAPSTVQSVGRAPAAASKGAPDWLQNRTA